MWIPLLIFFFIFASQANAQKRQAYRPRVTRQQAQVRVEDPPQETDSAPEGDTALRADAFAQSDDDAQRQMHFWAAHAREEASMCDPAQGGNEVHTPQPPLYTPVQEQPPVQQPAHPLSQLLTVQNLQSAVVLTEILGPPGGKRRSLHPYPSQRQH